MAARRKFGGATYDRARDHDRLSRQYDRVFRVMRDGLWRTLRAIRRQTGEPTTSISARLRDMRKPEFGRHEVERRYMGDGLWSYRLIVRKRKRRREA